MPLDDCLLSGGRKLGAICHQVPALHVVACRRCDLVSFGPVLDCVALATVEWEKCYLRDKLGTLSCQVRNIIHKTPNNTYSPRKTRSTQSKQHLPNFFSSPPCVSFMAQRAFSPASIYASRGSTEWTAACMSSTAAIFSPCAARPTLRHPADLRALSLLDLPYLFFRHPVVFS